LSERLGLDNQKILFITAGPYPHTGGLSTHLSLLSSQLKKDGNDVRIISESTIPRLKTLLTLLFPAHSLNRITPRSGLGVIWRLHRTIELLLPIVKRQIQDFSPDILHAQDATAAFAVSRALGADRPPLVLTCHGYLLYETLSRGRMSPDSIGARYEKKIEIKGLTAADSIVTVDTRISSFVKETLGESTPVTIIKNFLDSSQFSPQAQENKAELRAKWKLPINERILLCPRRLVAKNGVVFAAKALALLVHDHGYNNARLVIAGMGPEESVIRNEIRAKNLVKKVSFLGNVPHTDMPGLFTASDVVLIPSIYSANVEEATSISALEALSSGTPVVASSVGGLKEIIQDGKTGYLVNHSDAAAIAKACRDIFENPKEAAKRSEASVLYIKRNHSVEAATEKFMDIYQRLLETVKTYQQ